MNLGAKAYIDLINAQGGVLGRKIELKTRDDKYEADLAVENTKRFIGRGQGIRAVRLCRYAHYGRGDAGFSPKQGLR